MTKEVTRCFALILLHVNMTRSDAPASIRVKCPYRIHTRRILAGQIKQLAALESRTERQEAYLDRLKAQYAELLESG